MSVSLEQPMREAEIDLVKLANANEAAIAQEVQDRIAADTTLQNNINAEASAREAADTTLTNNLASISDRVAMVEGYFPVATANIADSAVEADKIADGTITETKLNEGIQNQLSFLASVPEFEFGTSNSFSVQGSSYHDVNVTFKTKTKAPIVLCGLQHATGNLDCVVTTVTNQQFSARVYNLTTTDVSDVTLDWLTISGR